MFSVVKELHKLNLNVFSELGDLSKIDLIVETEKQLIKVQVKYARLKDQRINLSVRKSGPNGYRYNYTTSDVDMFAVYCPDTDTVYWIPASEACSFSSSMSLRCGDSKKKNVETKPAENYLSFFGGIAKE